jgi:hypothetical protein
MYLHKQAEVRVMKSMINHCKGLVTIVDLAHPIVDDTKLEHLEVKPSDGAYIHNIDAMVESAGGTI